MYVSQLQVSDITYTDAHSRSLTPLNSHLLSKLSHQIQSLLKQLPTFDKLDVSCMIEFLMDVIKIHNVFDVCWYYMKRPVLLWPAALTLLQPNRT